MLDKAAARAKGLLDESEKTCLPLPRESAWKRRSTTQSCKANRASVKAGGRDGRRACFKNPQNLTLTPDSKELWVTCEASACVVIVDPMARRKIGEIAVGGQPHDVAFSPDGKRAFVSNRLDDNVSVVDVASRKVEVVIPVGDEPHGLLVDRQGRHLYVLNTSIDNISVVELATLRKSNAECVAVAVVAGYFPTEDDPGQAIALPFGAGPSPSLSEVRLLIRKPRGRPLMMPAANLLQASRFIPRGYALVCCCEQRTWCDDSDQPG